MSKVISGQNDSQLINTLILEVQASGVEPQTFINQLLEFLLDKSFEESCDLDMYIDVVSKIAMDKLPISDIIGMFALIQSKIRYLKLQDTTISKKKRDKVIESEVKRTKSHSSVKDSDNNLQIKENALDKNISQDIDELSKVVTFIKNLGQQSDAPMAIKIIKDFNIDIAAENVKIIVANTMHQVSLENKKNREWIENNLQKNFNKNYKIERIEVVKAELSSTDTKKTSSGIVDKINQNIDLEYSDKKNNKIFYKVYKTLPENMGDKEVQIYTSDIPKPLNIKSQRDSEIQEEDIFEFE